MYDAEMEGDIELKATCAPHYFRIVRQRQADERRQGIVRQRPDSMARQAPAATATVIPEAIGRTWRRSPSHERLHQGLPGGYGRLLYQSPRRSLPLRLSACRGGQHAHAVLRGNLEANLRSSPSSATPTCSAANAAYANSRNVCGGCRARAYGMT